MIQNQNIITAAARPGGVLNNPISTHKPTHATAAPIHSQSVSRAAPWVAVRPTVPGMFTKKLAVGGMNLEKQNGILQSLF